MTEQRFVDIESKIAHQDYIIEELNQVVYEQQKTIDKLQATLEALTKRIKGMQEILGDGADIRGPDEKPPHY